MNINNILAVIQPLPDEWWNKSIYKFKKMYYTVRSHFTLIILIIGLIK